MKVLYLTAGIFDKGGISRYGRYQISAIRDCVGPENTRVVSLLGPEPDGFETPFAVDYVAGGLSLRSKAAFTTVSLWQALSFRPDVVWATAINQAGVGLLAAGLSRSATITNVYGLEVWSPMRWDCAWGFRNSTFVTSDCHFTARYVEQQNMRPAGTVSVIWDCVDTVRFCPGRPNPAVIDRYQIPHPDTGINILTLGRMSRSAAYKGYERLLQVLGTLQDVPGMRLLYAGKGDLVDDLRRQASSLGLQDRVHFLGAIDEADLPDVYRSAHIFSLVSHRDIWGGEGIPLTPLEAAACGIPILVGNQDGSQEAVVDGINGYILAPFDLVSHAQCIRQLATDRTLRVHMGTAARRRIEQEHAYEMFRERVRDMLYLATKARKR